MSPVLEILASRFRSGRAGRSAGAMRDVILPFNDLLKTAGCQYGAARHEAERTLADFEADGLLVLERYARDPNTILKVRIPLACEREFFARLGLTGPARKREELAEAFRTAGGASVPEKFLAGWRRFCSDLEAAAAKGMALAPFDRDQPEQVGQILAMLPALLSWPSESHLRFASSVLCGNSKVLETLQTRVEKCLALITDGEFSELGDVGISETGRSLLVHGPVRLVFDIGELDLGLLKAPARLAISDVHRARLVCQTTRCLTVENASMLHELAKLASGTLLVSSGSEGGFANAAVVQLLQALPEVVELWHFGDSDPAGFDILRDLRERSRRHVVPLHMTFRPSNSASPLTPSDTKTISRLLLSPNLGDAEKDELLKMQEINSKGDYEQESLGCPAPAWPFF